MLSDLAERRGLRRLLLPLGVICVAAGLSGAIFSPLLSLFLSTDVAASPAQITLFLVASPLAAVAVSTVAGRLSDRYPIRRALLVATGVAGVTGMVAAAYVRDFWVLLALAVTVTAFAQTTFPQSFAYARQALARVEPGRSAMAISTLRMLYSAAWVGGPPIAAVIHSAGGFRYVYLLAAAAFAIAMLVALAWLAEPPPVPSAAPPSAGPDSLSPAGPDALPVEAPGAVRTRPNAPGWVLAVTVAGFTLLQTPLTLGIQALPLFVTQDLNGATSASGLILGLCAALEIPLMLGSGALATRLPLRGLILGGAVLGTAYYGLAGLATEVWMLLAGQLLNAGYIAAVTGLGISYVQDMLPREPGRATTLYSNTYTIGAMLAGPLFGVAQTFGIRWAYPIAAALCAAGLLLLLVTRRAYPV
ncbi:sugar efflux transporter [Catenuloplanes indicus]|uniref:SET family sugar efflux transporter-like MFS transporter n=1 Tax=Catenuloplanes indicus TaxID=137267 RepID=A0AAE3W8S9_9ACTN|nr:sugar efflux transporter [Catenuloplanes indicus]MDQ0370754.1 SET family sugar efflux transporter-like MFS transporter [Catenuloplanes indicus]